MYIVKLFLLVELVPQGKLTETVQNYFVDLFGLGLKKSSTKFFVCMQTSLP